MPALGGEKIQEFSRPPNLPESLARGREEVNQAGLSYGSATLAADAPLEVVRSVVGRPPPERAEPGVVY